jgi:hypothetical protein
MASADMVIFTRTFDFLTWLVPHTNHFPRAHRQTFTRRLLDAAFDLRECLELANLRQGAGRRAALLKADEALARVRVYLRLANQWGWQTEAQYGHAAGMLVEIGRMIGGWLKASGWKGVEGSRIGGG